MNITITIDGSNPKKAFEAGAFWQEYMTHASKCGCCGSTETIPAHRSVVAKQGPNTGKRYDYYEARCLNPSCGAVFSFGQKQDEGKTLFPKRDEGWKKFQKQDGGGGYNSGGNALDGDQNPPF
jgi:hypothetical protein